MLRFAIVIFVGRVCQPRTKEKIDIWNVWNNFILPFAEVSVKHNSQLLLQALYVQVLELVRVERSV